MVRAWLALRPIFVAAAGASLLAAAPARALTPDSPEVQAVIAKAASYLEANGKNDPRIGAQALCGLAFLKMGKPASHPRVAAAAALIRARVKEKGQADDGDGKKYSAPLALMFLAELDAVAYRHEIDRTMAFLIKDQKPHGGWGYDAQSTGDTSMTQYGVLAAWELKRAGILMPFASVERVTEWLLRTQDPSGGFGYQGTVSPNWVPVDQEDIRHSMTAAGLGSVYIAWDLLRLGRRATNENELGPDVKRVEPANREEWPATRLDRNALQAAMGRGNRWMEANRAPPDKISGWPYYYLYAVERYQSFRELADGRVEADPAWYRDGFEFLERSQQRDGSWQGQSGAVPDTAFGLLFLLRSSKKSIEKERQFGEGLLVGGRGLPKYTDTVQVREGQVVATPDVERVERLLAALEQNSAVDAEALASVAQLPAAEAEALVSKYAAELRALAGSDTAATRAAAIGALGNSGKLEHVPLLIHALDDADPACMLAAQDALRRVARRLDAPALNAQSTAAERRAEIERWKAWYLAVRPDAQFDNG